LAGPDGALYYIDLDDGSIHRVASIGSNHPPIAHATATPSQGDPPLTVQFSSAGTSDADGDPLTLTWNFGDGATSTDPAPMHTYASLGAYTAVLTVSDGRTPTPGTDTVSLPITVGVPPVVTISAPQAGDLFHGGQVIDLPARATDAQDGQLPESALHWEIRFQHDTHYHPYVDDLVGSPQQFTTATEGETSANVWYRVFLRATDSVGLTGEAVVDVHPETATMHFETSPPGLGLTLDGQPIATPADVLGVVGVIRTIEAPSPQGANTFDSWSDGGVQSHTISTPAVDTTYTATFDGPGATTTTSQTPDTTTSTTTTTTSTSTSSTTRAPTSTTTSSVAPQPPTTNTATMSSLVQSSTTTTSTVAPRCSDAMTAEAVACRIDQLADHVSAVAPSLGRSGRDLERRVRRASDRVQRAIAQ